MTLDDDLAKARAEFKRNELEEARSIFAPAHTEPKTFQDSTYGAMSKIDPIDVDIWWAKRWAAQFKSDGSGKEAFKEMTARANRLGRQYPERIKLEQLSSDQSDPERGDSLP